MKNILFLLFLILIFSSYVSAQQWDKIVVCSSDTLVVQSYEKIKKGNSVDTIFTNNRIQHKIVQCRTRSNTGFRVELGFSNYYYGENMTSWIGQHGSPNFNIYLIHNKFMLGIRSKPWTIDPLKELNLQNQILPTDAKLNVIKSDIVLGYSLDLPKLISVEPFIGLNRSRFLVINENEINQEFSFDKIRSPILGVTFNKYFKLEGYNYLSIFSTSGYSFTDYSTVNPSLEKGYFEWNLGLAYKGYIPKLLSQRVE